MDQRLICSRMLQRKVRNMKALKKSTLILAGDIGGTKTDIGFFVKGKRRPILKELKTYHSKQSSSLEEIIEQFLDNYSTFGVNIP